MIVECVKVVYLIYQLTTNTNTMKITSNKQKKTFTIFINGNKYLISAFTKAIFQELEYNTESDWQNYLKTQSYTII